MSINKFHTFVYDGRALNEFGALIRQKPKHIIAARDLDFVATPFKSGDVLIDNGRYENVDVDVPIRAIPSYCDLSFKKFAYELSDWLSPGETRGKKIYRDTYNPGYYRKGVVTEIREIVAFKRDIYDTTISFNFDPYMYLDSGLDPQTYTSSTTISAELQNPEMWSAEPIIQISGAGTFELTVNDVDVNVTVTSSIIIDKQQENVYDGNGNNANDKVSGLKLPLLLPGTNNIEVTRRSGEGDFNVTITPNWRRL